MNPLTIIDVINHPMIHIAYCPHNLFTKSHLPLLSNHPLFRLGGHRYRQRDGVSGRTFLRCRSCPLFRYEESSQGKEFRPITAGDCGGYGGAWRAPVNLTSLIICCPCSLLHHYPNGIPVFPILYIPVPTLRLLLGL